MNKNELVAKVADQSGLSKKDAEKALAAVIDTIAAMAPDRVVYVSCDPATLARDLKRFEEKAYRTVRITPVDMFPRTPHVETVVLMSRGGVECIREREVEI